MTDIIVADKTPTKEELQKHLKDAIKKIDAKLKSLMRHTSTIAKSPGNFKLNENDSNNINILTCIDIGYLLKGLGMLNRLKREYEQTAKEEKLDKYPPLTWIGINADLWIHDLRMRIAVVSNAALISGLQESRKKLETFLTEEQRLHSTLLEISNLIGIKS